MEKTPMNPNDYHDFKAVNCRFQVETAPHAREYQYLGVGRRHWMRTCEPPPELSGCSTIANGITLAKQVLG